MDPFLNNSQRLKVGLLLAAALVIAAKHPTISSGIKSHFSQALMDPLSVQYQIVSIKGSLTCGRYNAKNSYGAFVGFRPFFYSNLGHGTLYTVNFIVRPNGNVDSTKFIDDELSDDQIVAEGDRLKALLAEVSEVSSKC